MKNNKGLLLEIATKDVYKRQPEDKQRLKKEWGGIFTDLFEEGEVKEDKPLKQYNYSEPVSYTHLDVYKRQI